MQKSVEGGEIEDVISWEKSLVIKSNDKKMKKMENKIVDYQYKLKSMWKSERFSTIASFFKIMIIFFYD